MEPRDEVGESTLASISNADAFNRYMYETVRPYCDAPVLELGSGLGNISRFFVEDGKPIMLSDLRPEYCETLREKFASSQSVLGVSPIDLVAPSFETAYAEHMGMYRSVVALNVLEHIEDDTLAMQNVMKLLAPGGTAVILVPAYQWLFSRFDSELGHYRRYTTKRLEKLFIHSGFNVKKSWYFNSVGIAGWLLFGKLLGRKQIQEGQMKLYNTLVPLVKLADTLLLKRMGLSAICVGTKPS